MNQNRHKALALSLLTLFVLMASLPLYAQKVTMLEILNADLTAYDIKIGKDARKLIGNVRLKHDDVVMTCDSAYFYPSTSSVDAFSRVKIVQADTLTLTGDLAHYNGKTRIARVRNDVKLVNKDATLLTDSLNYDRDAGVAWYLGGGVLNQGDNELSSMRGRFLVDSEIFFFMDSVVIVNPEHTIYTDSLKYESALELSHFNGPTEIISEERFIYCEDGWYDMENDITMVNGNAYMEEDGRTLKGDTLYFEKESGYGRATSNVELIDTAQNTTLSGDLGIYYSDRDYAMVTNRAMMTQVDGTDTMYVHADTLRSVVNPDSGVDSRILKAYYHVKIYRSDIQVMCDSLVFVEADSIFDFYGQPILWAGENQLTSEHMKIFMANQKLDRMELLGVAFVASQKDSVNFDQMRGKEMTGYFHDNKLVKIDVRGNGQTIYYALEEDLIVGANKTISSDLSIQLKDNKISKIIYTSQPDGTYYPLGLFPKTEARLSDFNWYGQWRPLKWQDIFIWKADEEQADEITIQ